MKYYFLVLFTLIPKFVSAQAVNNLESLITKILLVIVRLVPLIIGIAVVAFLWGVFKYAIANDPKDRKTGIQFMINGIISLFVMTSLWGLVYLLFEFFGFDKNQNVKWLPSTEQQGNNSFYSNVPQTDIYNQDNRPSFNVDYYDKAPGYNTNEDFNI